MVRARKKVQGVGLYPQDWDRAKRNLEPDEHLIEMIEKALILYCEIREGKRREPQAIAFLVDHEDRMEMGRRPMSTL